MNSIRCITHITLAKIEIVQNTINYILFDFSGFTGNFNAFLESIEIFYCLKSSLVFLQTSSVFPNIKILSKCAILV